ncbi:Hypothetical protein NTJ_03856 [Nesidiocoris tenuis]|uniref:Uncharacterized protein n=1 Tax=Nesidiocoris tenuis TaxID=355587 RepID=A0ABN7AFK1_9HEMI|nr:Hypothetical protein NTJ_03856 [Nesidiocoris tenuis]
MTRRSEKDCCMCAENAAASDSYQVLHGQQWKGNDDVDVGRAERQLLSRRDLASNASLSRPVLSLVALPND